MIKAFTLLASFVLVSTSQVPTTLSSFSDIKEQIMASETNFDNNLDNLVAESIHLNDRRFARIG